MAPRAVWAWVVLSVPVEDWAAFSIGITSGPRTSPTMIRETFVRSTE